MRQIPLFLLIGLSLITGLGNWVVAVDVLSHFQLPILIATLAGSLGYLVSKKKKRFLILFSLTLYHLVMAGSYIPRPGGTSVSDPKQKTLKLLQYNMNANNDQYAAIIDQIRQVDPDIFVICEADHSLLNRLKQMESRYPYQFEVGRWPGTRLFDVSGTILWSKIPFHQTQSVTLELGYIQMIEAQIDYPEQPFTIIAAHLPSPVTPRQIRQRNSGIREIGDRVMAMPNAGFVVGDLNNTVWSAGVREFTRRTGYDSIYRLKGIRPTWPASTHPLGISIDHIFHSPHWKPIECRTLPASGSDHRMLLAEFILRPTSSP